MRQYIDHFSVANIVRMIANIRDSQAALVERDSDVRRVDALSEQHGYYAIPAHSRETLIGAVEVLAQDGWKIACTNVLGTEEVPHNKPVSLRHYPWFTGTWSEIGHYTRGLSNGRVCLVVLPATVNDPLEPSPDLKGHASPLEGRRPGGVNKEWTRQNMRRVLLIKKQIRQGLTPREEEELDQLQSEMSRQLNAAFPLPFDELDKLEEYVDQAERRLSGQS